VAALRGPCPKYLRRATPVAERRGISEKPLELELFDTSSATFVDPCPPSRVLFTSVRETALRAGRCRWNVPSELMSGCPTTR